MDMTYVGRLQHCDPLYSYFHDEIRPQLGLRRDAEYRVFRLHASNSVYLYEETRSLVRLIGKFYGSSGRNRDAARCSMENEFANLNYMRSFGFGGGGPHYIARPLGRNSGLGELLLEEECYGESYSSVLQRAILNNDGNLLYGKLTALAYFLSHFHNRTAQPGAGVDFGRAADYARGLFHTLRSRNFVSDHRFGKLHELLNQWCSKGEMYQDNPVIVHGDATPENFLFGDGLHVISFDLERMRRADRVFDLGRLCAETAHFFMLYTGNRGYAEPFIGHFLWEYSCHFPDRMAAFRSVTARLPFYMGINFLRIGRNTYFDWNYRQKLLNAGMECLKGGLHQ